MRTAGNAQRRSMLVLVIAVALATCLLAFLASRPAEAAGRYKVVTRPFSSETEVLVPGGTTTRVGPASPYPAEIRVAGLRKGRVLDVNLELNDYSHTCPEQVDMLLVGPTGRNAIPMPDMAGCSPITEGISLTLDDEGTVLWPVPLTSGTFQPFDNDAPGSDPFPAPAGGGAAPPQDGGMSLSTFDGTNPNGVWRLYVMDDDSTSLGRLAGGCSLTIKPRSGGKSIAGGPGVLSSGLGV